MTIQELSDEMRNKISMALKDPILQQGFEIICKENAELDMKRKAERQIFQGIVEKKNEHLTKAKELLQHFISMDLFQIAENDQDYNAIEQAEQFLKEIEK